MHTQSLLDNTILYRRVDIHIKRLIFEHANAIDLNDILITPCRICIKFYSRQMNEAAAATATVMAITTTTQ